MSRNASRLRPARDGVVRQEFRAGRPLYSTVHHTRKWISGRVAVRLLSARRGLMRFHQHRTWIVAQTELLVSGLPGGVDLRAPVPSCPGWTLGALLRHVGGGHRWAAEVVRTRADRFLPDGIVRDVDGDDTGPVPAGWLLDGAHELAAALGDAGPDAPVWTPFKPVRTPFEPVRTSFELVQTPFEPVRTPFEAVSPPLEVAGMPFWARRFAHETLMHRADATLAAGTPFDVDTDVAVDALDEWMELDAHPIHFELDPAKKAILGPGRTVALRATDLPPGQDAGWFVDLTGAVNTWRRGGGAAAVTVQARVRELLLLVYRRRTADGLPVTGDGGLLRHWLGHVAFG
jgi:uncharacterized protein (TIGR03083 family)